MRFQPHIEGALALGLRDHMAVAGLGGEPLRLFMTRDGVPVREIHTGAVCVTGARLGIGAAARRKDEKSEREDQTAHGAKS